MKDILKIAAKLLDNLGGYSINAKGQEPTNGYMVSLGESVAGKKFERVIASDLGTLETTYQIQRFVLENWELVLFSERLYFSVWLHEGNIYLDISENVYGGGLTFDPDTDSFVGDHTLIRERAETLAKTRNQLAYYDVKDHKTVLL